MNDSSQVLINRIPLAMARAIDLVSNERAHHTLCVRAPTTILNYKQTFELAWADRWQDQDEIQKSVLRQWYTQIELTELAAQRDIDRNYEAAKRRSVILLADLLEAYVETLLQLMQSIDDPIGETTLDLTGRRPRDVDDARDMRRSIRHWERRIDLPSRLQRLLHMLRHFLPHLAVADDTATLLDEMFEHRNALTHEIIQVSNDPASTHVSADASGITLERVDAYFDGVSDLIIATMNAWVVSPKFGGAPNEPK